MSSIKAYLGVARAPFLLLPVALVASGTAAAAWGGTWRVHRTALALVGLVALHIAVNVLNEVSDHRTQIDQHTLRTPFSGGSGTIQAGAMSARLAFVFALFNIAIGAGIGIYLLTQVGWWLLPIGLLGAFTVVAYTDVLARVGIGEFAAGIGLGALPVLGTALVQDGRIGRAAIAAAIPACLMTFNLLLLNEFPDEQADRMGGRRHLVIVLGRRVAAWIYVVAALGTPSAIVVAVLLRALPATALIGVVPSILLAKPVGWALRDPLSPVPVPALGANVAWNLLTNACLAIGLGVAAKLGM